MRSRKGADATRRSAAQEARDPTESQRAFEWSRNEADAFGLRSDWPVPLPVGNDPDDPASARPAENGL
jgi:hypothetical protein